MADVYDFKTGQLCKCCTHCKFWKGITDFPEYALGKYGVGPVCFDCLEKDQLADFTYTIQEEPDNEVA
ncbi:hypothetical protein KA005_45815 [bacterium]|nr:hypothetical protein [bacterium]